MMINNLFILSPSGEVLIEKQWRGQVKRTVCDTFLEQVTVTCILHESTHAVA